jgi:hypothetical protein
VTTSSHAAEREADARAGRWPASRHAAAADFRYLDRLVPLRGAGFVDDRETHLIVDAETGEATRLTDGRARERPPWSPDAPGSPSWRIVGRAATSVPPNVYPRTWRRAVSASLALGVLTA